MRSPRRPIIKAMARSVKNRAKRWGWLLSRYRRYHYARLWQAAINQSPAWKARLVEAHRHSLDEATASTTKATVFVQNPRHAPLLDVCAADFPAQVNVVWIASAHIHNVDVMPPGHRMVKSSDIAAELRQCAQQQEYVCFLNAGDAVEDDALSLLNLAVREVPDAKAIYQDYWQGNNAHLLVPWDPLYWHQHDFISRACWFSAEAIADIPVGKWAGENHRIASLLLKYLHEKNKPIYHQAGLSFTLAGPSSSPPGSLVPLTSAHPPRVTIIIPTRDNFSLLKQCIESITRHTTYVNYSILVVNNQSVCEKTLAYFEALSQQGHRVEIYNAPFNYSAINNWAVAQCDSEVVALVNDDIEVKSPHWLTRMVHYAVHPDTGCVGAKLLYPDNSIQHGGITLGIMGGAAHSYKYVDAKESGLSYQLYCDHAVSAVTAACLVVRRDVYEEVNGLDEENLTVAFNDVDFCLRVGKRGYRNVQCNTVSLYHHESQSRGEDISGEKAQRFAQERAFMEKRWKWSEGADKHLNPLLHKMFTSDY